MSVHSSQRKRRRDNNRLKFKGVSHNEFLLRIKKTLYYGEMPVGDTFSLPVTEFAAELYSKVKAGRSLERLRLEEAAEISHNTCVSPCCLVLAMLYLDRLKTCNPAYLNKAVPSELFLISAMVANKFLNDDGEEDEVINCEWAASAGLDLKDVNHLEKEFLKAIDWHVFVKDTSFWSRLRSMERDIALKEGKRRGWFSYTELENLLDSLDIITLAQTIVAVSVVCLGIYTAGVLTVVGSTLAVARVPNLYFKTQSETLVYHKPPSPEGNFNLVMQINDSIKEVKLPATTCFLNVSADSEGEELRWNALGWLISGTNKSETPYSQLSINTKISSNNCFESMTRYLYLLSHHWAYTPIDAVVTQFPY